MSSDEFFDLVEDGLLLFAHFLSGIEALMLVLDVEEDARFLGGTTWLLTTPDDYLPVLFVYFTYKAVSAAGGAITLRAAHAIDP